MAMVKEPSSDIAAVTQVRWHDAAAPDAQRRQCLLPDGAGACSEDDYETPAHAPVKRPRRDVTDEESRANSNDNDSLALAITAAAGTTKTRRQMPKLRVGINESPVDLVCDTGAAHCMIRKDTASSLRLPIQPCVGNEHPSFIMADGHRRSPKGFVQVEVDIEGCIVSTGKIVANLLLNSPKEALCPFAGLLGWDFMTLYGAHINADAMIITFNFEGREVSSRLSMTKQATSSIPVIVAVTVELRPHETQAILVKVTDGANPRADGQTWGFFAGAASGRFVCRNGYANVTVKRNLSA
jgi:hypothetical protein